MHHACSVVSSRFQSAPCGSWRGVKGGGEGLGILQSERMPGLQFEDTCCLTLDHGTEECGFVHGQRKCDAFDQTGQPVIVTYLGCPGLLSWEVSKSSMMTSMSGNRM